MKPFYKAILVLFLVLIIIGVFVLIILQRQAEQDIAANITQNITPEGPQQRYVIERPIISGWQFWVLVFLIFFLIVFIARPHWFRKLPLKRYKDVQHYWKDVYERMLIEHAEMMTGSSDKIIYPKYHFIKGNYYFAQIPNELMNYPESGGLPKVIVYNKDLGVIESPNEPVDMLSPTTGKQARKYLIDKYIEKKDVEPPKGTVFVTPLYPGGLPQEYT